MGRNFFIETASNQSQTHIGKLSEGWLFTLDLIDILRHTTNNKKYETLMNVILDPGKYRCFSDVGLEARALGTIPYIGNRRAGKSCLGSLYVEIIIPQNVLSAQQLLELLKCEDGVFCDEYDVSYTLDEIEKLICKKDPRRKNPYEFERQLGRTYSDPVTYFFTIPGLDNCYIPPYTYFC